MAKFSEASYWALAAWPHPEAARKRSLTICIESMTRSGGVAVVRGREAGLRFAAGGLK